MNHDLTPRALQTLAVANQIATKYNNSYVGTEHILLALLEAHGVVRDAFVQADVNVDALRNALIGLVRQTPKAEPKPEKAFDPAALLHDLADLVNKHSKTL